MVNRQFLNANHAALVEEILAEGRQAGHAAGLTAGAEAERARIQAVEAAAMPGCEKLINEMKYDGKTTGPEAASKVLAHYKQQNASALENLTADAAALPKVPATPSQGGDPNAAAEEAHLPIDERCKKRWDRDAKLRAEFADDFKAYLAFEKANAEGRVRILGQKAA
jgi:hypothetical protein